MESVTINKKHHIIEVEAEQYGTLVVWFFCACKIFYDPLFFLGGFDNKSIKFYEELNHNNNNNNQADLLLKGGAVNFKSFEEFSWLILIMR